MNNDAVHAAIHDPTTRRRLVAMAAAQLGSEADAEDCVQEALLLAARNAEGFEGRASAFTWLYRVVVNACRMQRRARRRIRRGAGAHHVAIEDLLVHPAADTGSDPEAALLGHELSRAVAAELRAVPDHESRLFAQVLVDPRSTGEIAREAGITRQALKSRVFRVRRRLESRLLTSSV